MGIEAKIERSVCAYVLKNLGVPNFKWGVDGWPDRCFLLPGGRPLFIEYKAPGAELMPRQAYRIKCLKTWGYEVYTHDNAAESIRQISRSLESTHLPMGDKSPKPIRATLPRNR